MPVVFSNRGIVRAPVASGGGGGGESPLVHLDMESLPAEAITGATISTAAGYGGSNALRVTLDNPQTDTNYGLYNVNFTDQARVFIGFYIKFGPDWNHSAFTAATGTQKPVIINTAGGLSNRRVILHQREAPNAGNTVSVQTFYMDNNILNFGDRTPKIWVLTTSHVNTTTNQLQNLSRTHGRLTGERCTYTSDGTAIGGLTSGTDYWWIKIDDNTAQVATSYANAIAGTAIDLTSVGSVGHNFTFGSDILVVDGNQSKLFHIVMEANRTNQVIRWWLTSEDGEFQQLIPQATGDQSPDFQISGSNPVYQTLACVDRLMLEFPLTNFDSDYSWIEFGYFDEFAAAAGTWFEIDELKIGTTKASVASASGFGT
jgi:hypothetical protein